MTTAKFVMCSACEEIYPKPQQGACSFCDEPEPEWQDWNPADSDLLEQEGEDTIKNTISALRNLLEERQKMQSDDGRLYGAVRDALVIVSQMEPNLWRDFYEEK